MKQELMTKKSEQEALDRLEQRQKLLAQMQNSTNHTDPEEERALKAMQEEVQKYEESERAEKDEEAKIAEQIKDVYAEAKAHGFDTKAIRAVVKLRKEDREKREEHELILGTYLAALGEI